MEINKIYQGDCLELMKQIETKKVSKIISKILILEKRYSQSLVKRACYTYTKSVLEKNKAEKKIKVLEQELSKAKARLNNE